MNRVELAMEQQSGIGDQIIVVLRRVIRAVDLHSRTLAESHGLTGPRALLHKPLQAGSLSAVNWPPVSVSVRGRSPISSTASSSGDLPGGYAIPGIDAACSCRQRMPHSACLHGRRRACRSASSSVS